MNSSRLAPPSAPKERTSSLLTHLKPTKPSQNVSNEVSTINDVPPPEQTPRKSHDKSMKHKRYASISNQWKPSHSSKSRRRRHESKKRSRKRELKKLKRILKKHNMMSKDKITLSKLQHKNKKSKLRKRKYQELRERYKEFVFDKNDYRIRKINKNIERREKRHRKEKLLDNIKQLNEKEFEKFRNVRLIKKLHHWIFKMKHFGPKVYEIRLSIIQMKIYLLNALQGLASLAILLCFHLTNSYIVPTALAIPGLYTIAYSACMLDIFGSIFGIITSYHLEHFYGFRPNGKKILRTKENDKKSNNDTNNKLRKDNEESSKPFVKIVSEDKNTKNVPVIKVTSDTTKEQINKAKTADAANVKIPNTKTNKKSKLALSCKKCCKRLCCKSNRVRPQEYNEPKNSSKVKASCFVTRVLDCVFDNLWLFFDSFFLLLNLLGKGNRSRNFVNLMGYLAWICTQLAWFLDLVYSAYYNWLSFFSQDCSQALDRCKINPQPSFCNDFDGVFWFISGVVGIRFFLRILFMFIIGLCFPTAPLRSFPPKHQESERPSSCSLSDVDYKKVPKQLLRPYREKPWLPLWPTTRTLTKTEKPEGQKKGGNAEQKRILTTKERHHEQVLQAFKDIRRGKVQVNDVREGARLRRVAGAPNTIAMPPDLMTAEARAWLSEETDTSMERENMKMGIDNHLPHHHFHQTRHRHLPRESYNTHKHHPHHALHHVTIDGKLEDSDSLTIIHHPESKIKVPIKKAVAQKLQDLSDRVSTDESWSGHTFSFYESIPQDEAEKETEFAVEDFAELRKLMEAAGEDKELDKDEETKRKDSWGGAWSSSDSNGEKWWTKW